MRETSWRTLMLMTTVLILVVIFEGTVRPRKPRTPLIGPAMAAGQPQDCNKPQDKPALRQPEPVMTVEEDRPVWLNDNLGDLSKMGWISPDESKDSEDSEDPSESVPPVPE